jgi:hypothetical protein
MKSRHQGPEPEAGAGPFVERSVSGCECRAVMWQSHRMSGTVTVDFCATGTSGRSVCEVTPAFSRDQPFSSREIGVALKLSELVAELDTPGAEANG